jgi:small subunit ribosomal protein S3
MIETKFIKDIVREFQIQEYIADTLRNVGFSHSKVHKTPLGEKVIIYASRPGLVVGRKGENIQKLTQSLKSRFKLENPQIEIIEIEYPNLDAFIVAEKISSSLERFGLSKFKGIGHKAMFDVMNAGARGIEILISGKIPSARAKRWRFYQGYLKKSGDVAITGIRKAYAQAHLKTGVVGIQVRIMPPDLKMPDTVTPKVTLGDVMSKNDLLKKSDESISKPVPETDKKDVKKTTKRKKKESSKEDATNSSTKETEKIESTKAEGEN